MLTIPGLRTGRFCDGMARRDFLKIGGLVMGGLSLPQILRAEAQFGIRKSPGRPQYLVDGWQPMKELIQS